MSRQYPRFLYSDPQNTKSKGPFIVHTIEPFCILKVNKKMHMGFTLNFLFEDGSSSFTEIDTKKHDEVLVAAHHWLKSQIDGGFITL